VDDSLLTAVLGCTHCNKGYKIIPQELQFYRTQNLPLPASCFQCRHSARLRSRLPRRLWQSSCMTCNASFETVYDPARTTSVQCEPCFLDGLL
jgi:hypothetical protein